jgi:hypothetical protein
VSIGGLLIRLVREKETRLMEGVNYSAVLVAAAAAFVGSSVWYALLGAQLATVSVAFAELRRQRPAGWRMLVVAAGTLVPDLASRPIEIRESI